MNKDKDNNIIKIRKQLLENPRNRVELFKLIPINEQAFVLLSLNTRIQKDLLEKLSNEEIINLLHYPDPDETTYLLRRLSSSRRKKIINELNESTKEKVEFLLRFNPRTAAGMMSLDYLEIDKKTTFKEVSEMIKLHEKKTGKITSILVIENGFFLGELPWHSLALSKPSEKVEKYIKSLPKIKFNQSQHDIINAFKKHPHNKLVVLDEDKSVLGIIYSDDVLRLIQEQPAKDLYSFAGVKDEEDVLDSAFTKVKYRYKWLIINLCTTFLAALVISLFQETISAFVLLAIYMPIVAGMGGNAGTQTMAVVVRGITLKEIELKSGKKVILNEMIAGSINGLINGIIVALIAVFWNQNPLLGVILGIAMIVNLIIAGFFGAMIPLLMKYLGKDPASSATIFITTATDVFGFFVFLGLASFLL